MKDDLLKARVSKTQKEGIQRIAAARGEAEAVIIREALAQYIERHDAASAEVSSDPYPKDLMLSVFGLGAPDLRIWTVLREALK